MAIDFILLTDFPLEFRDKTPTEVLTFGVDFKNELASGETIASGVWTITPDKPSSASIVGMIIGSMTISGTQVFQKIGFGDVNARYCVTPQISTDNGNVIEANIFLNIKDC